MDNITRRMHNIIKSGHHLLVEGPSGAGKTFRVTKLAKQLECAYDIVNAVSIETVDDLLNAIQSNVSVNEYFILIIDEIHNLNFKIQNALLTLLETFKIRHRNKDIHIAPNTICAGLTTNGEKLFKPLKNRFLQVYVSLPTRQEKAQYVAQHIRLKSKLDILRIIDAAISYRDLSQIAKLANALDSVDEAMFTLQYDKNGLNEPERQFLTVINTMNMNSSINSIASAMNIDTETAQNIERNLILKGMIEIDSKGRHTVGKGKLYK